MGGGGRILVIGRDWSACRPADDAARRDLVDLLLRCSEGVLVGASAAETSRLR